MWGDGVVGTPWAGAVGQGTVWHPAGTGWWQWDRGGGCQHIPVGTKQWGMGQARELWGDQGRSRG